MPTTLTAIPQPATASVLLQVSGAPAGAVTITRSDASGIGPVRLLAGQQPITGSMVAADYEAALTGTLTYTLVDSDSVAVTKTTALTGLVVAPWLSVPVMPQLGRQVPVILDDYAASQDSRGTLHQVIGAPEPVPTLAPLSSRTGGMTVLVDDYTTARAVTAVHSRGQVVQLRQPTHPGMDMYYVATRVDASPDGPRWRVRIDYTEVSRPAGPLLGGLGWDFAALSAAYPDFRSAQAAFADFTAMQVGP